MKSLTEHIKESQMITEMASELKDYRNDVMSILDTFVDHFCLLIYCRLYDEEHLTYNHWCKEVRGYFNNDLNQKLKNKANKFSIIKNIIIKKKYIDKNVIEKSIKSKFKEEQIIDNEKIKIVSDICATHILEFIEEILNSNNVLNDIKEFIKRIPKDD